MTIIVRRATVDGDVESCMAIRQKVFIEEQNVPHEEEIDGLDDESAHYIIEVNHIAVGTARVRHCEHKAKIERVAILADYRGQGFGKKIMAHIIADIAHAGKADQIVLSAQNHAIPFYENMGFKVCSEEYSDADIPHKDMYRLLDLT